MKIQIRGRQFEITEALRAHGERSLEFALGRFRSRIAGVTALLLDVNGPRGGIDKCCRLVVRLRPNGIVCLEELAGDAYAAVERAAGRAGSAVARRLAHGWRFPEVRRAEPAEARRKGRVVVPFHARMELASEEERIVRPHSLEVVR